MKDQETAAIVYLPNEGSWSPAEVLTDHEREAWDWLQAVVRDMKVRLKLVRKTA